MSERAARPSRTPIPAPSSEQRSRTVSFPCKGRVRRPLCGRGAERRASARQGDARQPARAALERRLRRRDSARGGRPRASDASDPRESGGPLWRRPITEKAVEGVNCAQISFSKPRLCTICADLATFDVHKSGLRKLRCAHSEGDRVTDRAAISTAVAKGAGTVCTGNVSVDCGGRNRP